MVGITGRAARTTALGTEYVTFCYKVPRFIKYFAYFLLMVHMLLGYLHKRFSKPPGDKFKNLGYSSVLVWRCTPTWRYEDGCTYLLCRYCFDHKYTLEEYKSLGLLVGEV